MNCPQPWLAMLIVLFGGTALGHAAKGRDDGSPTYTNAQVVAVDVSGRTLVIRNARGVVEKMQLDDGLAGFGDVKAGDRVMLTVRTGPGWTRVSSIVKSKAVPAPRVAAGAPPTRPEAAVDGARALASPDPFAAQVADLAGQADQVDRLWNEFRKACDLKAETPHEGARGWFAVWEGSTGADLSGGFCRDLFNQIVDLAEPINTRMTAAEDVARRSLSPGEIREIRRRYAMDWDGWGRTPPKRLEP
jgi:hypothetical protein